MSQLHDLAKATLAVLDLQVEARKATPAEKRELVLLCRRDEAALRKRCAAILGNPDQEVLFETEG